MTTRARAVPKVRVYWHAPPGLPRATLVREAKGETVERELGPRSRLTLAEAAAVLDRSPAEVYRAIRTGFLPARRVGEAVVVTFGACYRYIEEIKRDLAEARATEGEPTISAEEVHARLRR